VKSFRFVFDSVACQIWFLSPVDVPHY
jgi:hypothetical protein